MENFLYKNILRPLLFRLEPEKAHNIIINLLKILRKTKINNFILNSKEKNNFVYEFSNLKFKNIIGLAAGLDKNGEIYDILAQLGFGFIEIGTVTLNPQEGNAKPRLFRLKEEKAIINRMGFNNIGAKDLAKNIEKIGKIKIPLGINIGKDNLCPLNEAYKNYAQSFNILNSYGDYFTINISCPNIKDLCILHKEDFLKQIIESLLKINDKKTLFLKISPDLDLKDLENSIKVCKEYKIGLISTNTTIKRFNLNEKWQKELGGLSGKPLKELSLKQLKEIRKIDKDIPIISCGGIDQKEDIIERINNGANLIQIYTSFIYEGPGIIKKLNQY